MLLFQTENASPDNFPVTVFNPNQNGVRALQIKKWANIYLTSLVVTKARAKSSTPSCIGVACCESRPRDSLG